MARFDAKHGLRAAGNLLRRLEWTVLRPLASRLGGDERSLLLGAGMEIDELREYQPGDDVRQMDWNMMARLGKPYVRQSRVTRALDVWLALDVSPSVDWGTARMLKRERAVEFVSVVGQIFLRHNHHVGALLFADAPLAMIPPSAGQQHLLRLVDAVSNEANRAGSGATDLHAALTRFERALPRRSFIILVTDFLTPPGWQNVLLRLVQRHEVVAVCLRDPRESELPDVGMIALEDPETGRQLVVDTGNAALRERFQAAAAEQAARLRADLSAAGVDLLELSTADDLLPVLVRFLEKRRRQATLLNREHAAKAAASTRTMRKEAGDAL